jgi:hypothetical protein
MRRAQAILVIIALLATPLALLARAIDPGMPDCNGMCCLPRHSHHSPTTATNPSSESQQDAMACHHGAAGHMMECSMKSGQPRMDYGLVAPFPPARTSALASLNIPKIKRHAGLQLPAANSPAGFLASPFQPPRS